MIKKIVIVVASIFFQACYGSNVISLSYITNDIAYSKVHGKLYALVDAMDPVYGNRLVEININTGVVERSQFVGSEPFLMRLTSDENYAWISFSRIPYVRRIDLNTFQVDKEIYLGPSKKYVPLGHRMSTILAYNFTVFPNKDNELALGLQTPYFFDWEAISLYRNDTIQPRRMEANTTSYPPFCFEPVLNGNYLVGHHQSSSNSVYSRIKVLDNGLEFRNDDINEEGAFTRNFFKVHNDTLYSADGTILDATDSSNIKVLGKCENQVIGDRYGFVFSGMHNAFLYPNIHNDSIYLTFYDKTTFTAFDSVFLLDYSYYEIMLILELEIIDHDKFAILIGKDYGDFTIRIIETFPLGTEPIQYASRVRIFPNPASDKVFINGGPVNKDIRVYDVTGNLLGSYERSGVRAEINLENYNPGIYLVRITDTDNKSNSVVKKIVKR